MGNSDEKKINFFEFMDTVKKLNKQIEELRSQKKKLNEVNNKILEDCNWKGISKNYYIQIAEEQDKTFQDINDELENSIKDLIDTSEKFKNLDNSFANGYQR